MELSLHQQVLTESRAAGIFQRGRLGDVMAGKAESLMLGAYILESQKSGKYCKYERTGLDLRSHYLERMVLQSK